MSKPITMLKTNESIKIEDLCRITPYLDDLNLTEKQRLFCWNYYYNGHNGVDAIEKAGYEVGVKGKKTQKSIAVVKTVMVNEYLNKPSIRAALKLIMENDTEILKMRIKHGIIDILQTMAAFNISDIIDDNGKLKMKLSEMPEELQKCIKNIKTRRVGKYGEIKIQEVELIDRTWAFEKLIKYVELIQDISEEGKKDKMPEDVKNNLEKFFLKRNDLLEA